MGLAAPGMNMATFLEHFCTSFCFLVLLFRLYYSLQRDFVLCMGITLMDSILQVKMKGFQCR